MVKRITLFMANFLEVLRGDFNSPSAHDKIMLRGNCPFCSDKVTFRARTYNVDPSKVLNSQMVGIQCEGCGSISSYNVNENKLYPAPMLESLKDLPKEISNYYLEGVRCISADAPNGAVTLFRKVIHALGIHYKISEKEDNKILYDIIKELHTEGHIVEKIKDALLGIKDIGNDGAHINENEPSIDQAKTLKELIDVVLNSTVLCDTHLETVKKMHEAKEEVIE